MLRFTPYYILSLLCILNGATATAIEAACSHTVFYMPQANSKIAINPYVEVYWQINPKTIAYSHADDDMWMAKVVTTVTFTDESGVEVKADKYIMQTTPADTAQLLRQNIIELHRYELPAGKYVLNLQLADVSKLENIFSYTDTVLIMPVAKGPFYSGLQLLDTVMNNSRQSPFLRNDRQQIPLCFNFLDDDKKNLHFYAELYKSATIGKDSAPLVQHIYISKKRGEQWSPSYLKTDTVQPAAILPFNASFNVESLTSGNYFLNIELYDKYNNQLAASHVFFQRSNTAPVVKKQVEDKDTVQRPTFEKVEVFDLAKTFVSKYNTQQLKAILKMLLPISTPIEQKSIATFLKKPEETYMRYFIYNFWASRSEQNPEKLWQEYADKVKEVNKLFGSPAIPGYETDRGLTWLKYGKPEERIIVQNEQGVLPYEIWKYNAPGKQSGPGLFLFYRPGFMVTDYRMLHSTVNGEMRNLNWRTVLYSSGGGNANSRAEQYIGNK